MSFKERTIAVRLVVDDQTSETTLCYLEALSEYSTLQSPLTTAQLALELTRFEPGTICLLSVGSAATAIAAAEQILNAGFAVVIDASAFCQDELVSLVAIADRLAAVFVGDAISKVRLVRAGVAAEKVVTFLSNPHTTAATITSVRNELMGKVKQEFTSILPMLRCGSGPKDAPQTPSISNSSARMRPPRILMLPREGIHSHPGGDSVVLDKLVEILSARGFDVVVDPRYTADLAQFDMVHLFNFSQKAELESRAIRCQQIGVPYVVTTFYEDWPKFHTRMMAAGKAAEVYTNGGQRRETWRSLQTEIETVQPAPIWDNSLSANGASALLASGKAEADSLSKHYPGVRSVVCTPFGTSWGELMDGGALFKKEFGLEDFILCVGRFEYRKNQWMLLKALEESDLTVVFAGGGFSYQPEYVDLCKKFRRPGRTVFLPRLDPKLLASCYQAARVHVLPSWCELPGLVSLEAASYGTNVVASSYGTIRDYLGDYAFYCDPADPQTIFNAVMAAYNSPVRPELVERARSFTWDRTAYETAKVYQQVLGSKPGLDWSAMSSGVWKSSANQEKGINVGIEAAASTTTEASRIVKRIPSMVGEPIDTAENRAQAEKLCDQGDELLKAGKLDEAVPFYEKAIQVAPRFPRAPRSLAVVSLQANKLADARKWFNSALAVDELDTKSVLGLGQVLWREGMKEEAFSRYLEGAKMEPGNASAILCLVSSAYELDRLEELEQALRGFLVYQPDNLHIMFCLAGCAYKRKRFILANEVIDRVLVLDPQRADALELKQKIKEELDASLNKSVASAQIGQWTEQEATFIARIQELKSLREYDKLLELISAESSAVSVGSSFRQLVSLFKAESLACLSKVDEADAIYKAVPSGGQFEYRVLCGRGAIEASRSNWTDAEKLFSRSAELNPEYDVTLSGLGLCAIQRDDYNKAWEYYESSLRVNPENLQALYGIIQAGYKLNRLAEMKAHLAGYLEYHPINFSIQYSYAGCLYKLGEITEARAELNKILIFDPTHTLALELLREIDKQSNEPIAKIAN
jgi:glycosyltransferase involved in cell wall biosynthesis/tetratricopeptide (TPR) repeat protein